MAAHTALGQTTWWLLGLLLVQQAVVLLHVPQTRAGLGGAAGTVAAVDGAALAGRKQGILARQAVAVLVSILTLAERVAPAVLLESLVVVVALRALAVSKAPGVLLVLLALCALAALTASLVLLKLLVVAAQIALAVSRAPEVLL